MTRSALIGHMMVASALPVVVYGNTRGLVSSHRTTQSALRRLTRDRHGCRKQGGYSDARIYVWADDEWKPA